MAEQFPSNLPLPLERGHTIKDSLHVRQNDVEIGPPRFELLSKEGPISVKVNWTFTPSEMSTFEQFFRTTIVFGSKSFTMDIASGQGLVQHEFYMPSFTQTTNRKLWSVKADLIGIQRIFTPLEWDSEPTGTYFSISLASFASIRFAVSSLGDWGVNSVFDQNGSFDGGFYRSQTIGDDKVSYEIKITQTAFNGGGTVTLLNNVVLGTFVDLTGGQGYEITDAVAGPGNTFADLEVEIREKLAITNSTGIATFCFDVEGEP